MTALTRTPRPGDLDLGVPREYPTPGRDCPACTAGRDEHDGWGAQSTGCRVPFWRLVKGTGVAR